ncbi:M23 family metallopeptidase [Arsukibacterium sp.]|uniref:M23 family metallopeptidase n=1 Tax=Arsukibacterium sp. TaxID=1977258 RepID=UPI00299E28DF|nr:M23 family metallopeptidase [Arsukibacterium sp.]MDX1536701.1 M23 family metallopeptidase [Arsukibacterium sp.]
MKDRIIISVSSINGTRHFSVSKLFKRNAVISLWLILFTVIITAAVIDYLLKTVDDTKNQQLVLAAQAEQLVSEITELSQTREQLQQELAIKQDEMLQVSNRLGEIELTLGLEQQFPQDLEARLDTATVNSSAKMAMLQLVPNGSPLEFRRRSSRFGVRTHPIMGKQQHHNGIDLSANRGTPIYAPADGVVEVVRPSKNGYGNLLKIRHAFGFSTLYAHLDEFKVGNGLFVHKGQLIATSGNTGNSTAPHLHYEIHFLDRSLNPQNFMDWDANNFDLVFEKERSIKWDSLVTMLQTKASTQLQLSSLRDAQLSEVSD